MYKITEKQFKEMPVELQALYEKLPNPSSDEVVSLFPNDSQRFFYCAKASKSERNMGCEELEEKMGGSYEFRQDGSLDGSIPSNSNNHPTVKPIALMEYLVKLVSREGATVLDPFMGSGSTGMACKNLNRDFIGIEIDPDYCKIAEARIRNTPTRLF
jgi:DNA modification methylase